MRVCLPPPSRYSGAANKNIGDAFLLVWSLNEHDLADYVAAGHADSVKEAEVVLQRQEADNALYAFMKIVVDIENNNTSGTLSKYGGNAKLVERFPGGFRVRMGFGLHHGWAIEGTGSCVRAWV